MITGLKGYECYRQTTLPWAPKLPAHWETERGKALFLQMSRAVRPGDEVITCFRDGRVTLRRNRRATGYTEAIKEFGYQGVRQGDLVIHAMDAFAGAVGVSESDGKGTPVYAVCVPKGQANTYYYAQVVREMARRQWILALSRGIRERSTDFRYEAFATQSLPVPPPDEQAAIVHFLNHADRRIRRYIAAKQKLIKLLEEQKQAIIHQAVTRGLDPSVPMRSTTLQQCSRIPSHWEILPLKRVLWRLIDCEHKTAPMTSVGDRLVVRTTAVRQGALNRRGTYLTTPEAFAEWTRRGVPESGDVIFTREAPVGEACVVPANMKVCLGQRTVLMKINRERLVPEYLVHQIYTGPARHEISVASQGTTVGHFNMHDIGNLPVLLPPLPEQQLIVTQLRARLQRLQALLGQALGEIDLLQELRTRLIADVVTGQLDVRAAAAALPELPDEDAPEDGLGLDEGLGEDDNEEATEEVE